MTYVQSQPNNTSFVQGEITDLPARKINRDTCKRYDYRVGKANGKPVHIANYKNSEGSLNAQKLRYEDKSFSCNGSPTTFFGQHLFPNGGHHLCIT